MNNNTSTDTLLASLFHGPLKDELQTLLDCIQDGIFITDGAGNIIACNEASLNYCYQKREDLIGKNMGALVAQQVFEDSVSMQAIETRSTVSVLQRGVTGKRDLLVTATPYFVGDEISFVVLTERDITELERLQETLNRLNEKYEQEMDYYRSLSFLPTEIISESGAMKALMTAAARVSATDASVLIQGDSGTGKSLIAKFIHRQSPRASGPFIEINCGAVPENLLESEFFGYEKGAFTGASEKGKAGLFELADGGTLFLDEIGALPLHLQVKVLRAIQEKEIIRVGGTKYTSVDIRIISATNSNLETAVKSGTFRKDLYYRLNICQFTIPPLRDRREDIVPLCRHFLDKFNSKYQCRKDFTSSAWRTLYSYQWPGNIRELENMIERIVILSNADRITAENISTLFPLSNLEAMSHNNSRSVNLKDEVDNFERNLILAKSKHFHSVTELAEALSIDKSTATRKLQKYNIRL